MADDAADFFRFLTNSYLSEPTAESAQRLWRAVFALPGLYFLMRDVGGETVPAIALDNDTPALLVWTDIDSLREYVRTTDPTNVDPNFLLAPLPKVVDTILRFQHHGVDAVRFNAPLGWSVPMERLKAVAEELVQR